MLKRIVWLGILTVILDVPSAQATSIQVYGVWHCGSDYCTWASVRNMTDFDTKNHWLTDRGDGVPSVNLVILSFVQPMKLLNLTNDSQTVNGIPVGMNAAVVNYFTNHNIRVMISIGGETYTNYWDQALAANAAQLGTNAANAAKALGVGMEIDYENSSSPNLTGLQAFINAYRAILPYEASGNNPAARLTIDLGAGDRYLIPLAAKATSAWLNPASPVLDYANAMVPSKQPSATTAESNWQEHITGNSRMSPPVPPLAPARLTGSVYLVTGRNVIPECNSFTSSLEDSTSTFVETVPPNGAGTTDGMLGYMFWAAECQGTKTVCTTPPNTCEGGVGMGSTYFNIPIPMPPLRQQ